jgi:hypothetical protein
MHKQFQTVWVFFFFEFGTEAFTNSKSSFNGLKKRKSEKIGGERELEAM